MKNKNVLIIIIVVLVAFVLLYLINNREMTSPSTVSTSSSGTTTQAINNTGLTQMYVDEKDSFSIRLPQDYIVNNKHEYSINPEENIKGVSFSIPLSIATGTNLSPDSYIAVESMPNVKTCNARMFMSQNASSAVITDGTITYSKAITGDAGAGNRYEETVYSPQGTKNCFAVRYFVHYGVLENYPANSVKEFDKTKLINTFDTIRRSLEIKK